MEKEILDLLAEMNERLKMVEETLNRIETSQEEALAGM